MTDWLTCTARASIFPGNLNISDLNHQESTRPPQHMESPWEPVLQDLGKIWDKWETATVVVQQIVLQNPVKQNDPYSTIFQV